MKKHKFLFCCFGFIASLACPSKQSTPVPHAKNSLIDFTKAAQIRGHYDSIEKALIVDVVLQDNVHAYAAGESIGKPVELEVHPDNGWLLGGAILLPAGKKETIGNHQSVVLKKAFQIKAPLKNGHDNVEWTLKMQLCTNDQCDRPRQYAFSTASK